MGLITSNFFSGSQSHSRRRVPDAQLSVNKGSESESPAQPAATVLPAEQYDRSGNDILAYNDPWREKMKRYYLHFRAFMPEIMMSDKIQKQNEMVRESIRRTQSGTLGQPDAKPSGTSAEPEMNVRIGDDVHNYLPQQPQQQNSGIPGWVKAGLLATAAGLGGAGVASYINKPDAPAPPAEKKDDNGTAKSPTLDPGGLSIEVIRGGGEQ